MGKIIVEVEISLDGVMNSPDFFGEVFKYHGDDVLAYLSDLLFVPDALLMGRITYEGFVEVWPSSTGKDADRINSMPKYVASRTLKEPLAWNAALLKGDVAGEIGRLKQELDNGLLQYGIGELTHTMLRHDLIDELRLLVYPFTVGKGDRIFDNMDINSLQLLDTRTFSTGVVALRYQPLVTV